MLVWCVLLPFILGYNYLVQSFLFMYVMWGVPNIQDRADWGGQAWLFQIIHVLCVLKVLARHPSADPRFAQSNERAYESHATRSHSLRARTTPSIVCETSADSLVNVSEASARSEFYGTGWWGRTDSDDIA